MAYTSGSSSWFSDSNRIYYDYSISGKRISNSEMEYTLKVTPHLRYSDTWFGTGNVFNLNFYVGNGSGHLQIKGYNESWEGQNPTGVKTLTVRCASNSQSTVSFVINWDMEGSASGYAEDMSGSRVSGSIATDALLYTNCTAPTSVLVGGGGSSPVSSLRMVPGVQYAISWSGAKNGVNNPIRSYDINVYKNGYIYTTWKNVTSPHYFSGFNSRGDNFNFYVVSKSDYNKPESSAHATTRVNRLPAAPVVSPSFLYIKSTATTGTVSITPGKDPDGDNVTVVDENGKTVNNSTQFAVKNYHSLYTKDNYGEKSSSAAKLVVEKNQIAQFSSTSKATFQKSEIKGDKILVKELNSYTFKAYKGNNHNKITAQLYVRTGEQDYLMGTMDISNLSYNSSNPSTFTFTSFEPISKFVKVGSSFTLFVTITDDLGEKISQADSTTYYYPFPASGDIPVLSEFAQDADEKTKITQASPANTLLFNNKIVVKTQAASTQEIQLSSTTKWYFESITSSSNKKSREINIIPGTPKTLTISDFYERSISFDEKFKIHSVVTDSFGDAQDKVHDKIFQRISKPVVKDGGSSKFSFTGTDYHYFTASKPSSPVAFSFPPYETMNGARYKIFLTDRASGKTFSLFTDKVLTSAPTIINVPVGNSYFDSIVKTNFSPTTSIASDHRVDFTVVVEDNFGNRSQTYTPTRNNSSEYKIILLEKPVFPQKTISFTPYYDPTNSMASGVKSVTALEILKFTLPSATDYNNRTLSYEVSMKIGGVTTQTNKYQSAGSISFIIPNYGKSGKISFDFLARNNTGTTSFSQTTDFYYYGLENPQITVKPDVSFEESTRKINFTMSIGNYGISSTILKRDNRGKTSASHTIAVVLQDYIGGTWNTRETYYYSASELVKLPQEFKVSYVYAKLPTENFPMRLLIQTNIGFKGSSKTPVHVLESYSPNKVITVTAPTFSTRKHAIGVNASGDLNEVSGKDAVAIIKNYGDRRFVRFVGLDLSGEVPVESTIEFDLVTGTIISGIIDGGDASQFSKV